MYHRQQLEVHAATIEHKGEQQAFKQNIKRIRFDVHGLCKEEALDIFDRANLSEIRADFQSKHVAILFGDTHDQTLKIFNQNTITQEEDDTPIGIDNGVIEYEEKP